MPTVGTVDYPLPGYSRNPFGFRCVVALSQHLAGVWDRSFRGLPRDSAQQQRVCICSPFGGAPSLFSSE